MYLDMRITARYGNRQAFIGKPVQEIGVNLVAAPVAVANSIFAADADTVVPKVIAAEQILNNTSILYFLEGSTTIRAHVEARTVVETKQQADRIARQTRTLFEKPSVKATTNAVIYAKNYQGFDTAIIRGRRISLWSRFVDAFTERWLARIATPAILFALAVAYMRTTTVFQAALFGFVAAAISLLIESIVVVARADDWKWEEVNSEY